jgi:hypothetical protein
MNCLKIRHKKETNEKYLQMAHWLFQCVIKTKEIFSNQPWFHFSSPLGIFSQNKIGEILQLIIIYECLGINKIKKGHKIHKGQITSFFPHRISQRSFLGGASLLNIEYVSPRNRTKEMMCFLFQLHDVRRREWN